MTKQLPPLPRLLMFITLLLLIIAENVLSWSAQRVWRLPGSLFMANSPPTKNHNIRKRKLTLESGKSATIRCRLVPVTSTWNLTVWEWNEPSSVMEHYWTSQQQDFVSRQGLLDPFGLVSWPGSVIAAKELLKYRDEIENSTVVILGAGPGVEAQAAAVLGARKVIATDIHPTTLQLLSYGAQQAGFDKIIQGQGTVSCSDEV